MSKETNRFPEKQEQHQNVGNLVDTAAIVIPSFNPDEKIIVLAKTLRQLCNNPIIFVNDGSAPEKQEIFQHLSELPAVTILAHEQNYGKGKALKTAFAYYLRTFPNGAGVVTADGDGQHSPRDIVRGLALLSSDRLLLGCRVFDEEHIPFKSRFGNKISRKVYSLLLGSISDTQTGLRGLPAGLLPFLLDCPGDRFEFETQMFLTARKHDYAYREYPIETIYEQGNRGSHFRPVRDSFIIYRTLFSDFFRQLLKFGFSGALSASLDLGIFSLLFYIVLPALHIPRLIGAVILARICSAIVNYLLNKNCVFGKWEQQRLFHWKSFGQYWGLCVCIMLGTYLTLKVLMEAFPQSNAVLLKMIVDTIFFIISFQVQRNQIFARSSC